MEWLASIKDTSYQQRTDLPEELKKETAELYTCLSDVGRRIESGGSGELFTA
jgi:hypothetical protein